MLTVLPLCETMLPQLDPELAGLQVLLPDAVVQTQAETGRPESTAKINMIRTIWK
jgi:hypothetical protein